MPFLEESLARYYYYQGNAGHALEIINNALAKVKKLGAQTFIGAWLLGTHALVSNSTDQAEASLAQGQLLLDKGCIGHNYFRFHTLAMEVGITHQREDIIERHLKALRAFTEDEPTPWSDFYIHRAEFVVQALRNGEYDHARHQALIAQGEEAGLATALPALSDLMRHRLL